MVMVANPQDWWADHLMLQNVSGASQRQLVAARVRGTL